MINDNEIVCLQETWYSKQDLTNLNTLHGDYRGSGVTTVDYGDRIVAGHPPGGVAIMWHRKLEKFIKPVDLNTDWCNAIEICIDNNKFYVINIYMPYQCQANEERYTENIGMLSAIIEELDNSCFVIMGDWNANLSDVNNSVFASHVLKFCEDNKLKLSSRMLLPADTYTYISESWNTTSWLDHAISSTDFHDIIVNMLVCYEISDADHIPFSVHINHELVPELSHGKNSCTPKMRWDTLSPEAIRRYQNITEQKLSNMDIPEAINCDDISCTNGDHVSCINDFYEDIIRCLVEAGDATIRDAGKKQNFVKPGWDDYVADLYKASKEAYKLWANSGKQRQGLIHETYVRSRARCKYAIRYIKAHEKELCKESLARKMSQHDYKSFWKEIKLMNNSKTPLPTNIDGISGDDAIAELWKKHFMELFNCVKSRSSKKHGAACNYEYSDVLVSSDEVEKAIKQLDNNKACGLDGVYAEHLKYSNKNLCHLLSLCITSCMVHGVLPKTMLMVVLTPVIKDKAGKITAKDNYRPIALANIISKVFEIILINRMSEYIETEANQYGFKKKHGTDQCIYILKEIIDAYRVLNGSIFACFLDASKAFDRVNHGVLFDKLIERGVPGYIVKILIYWYSNQQMCVKWGNVLSDHFTVSNGVRQGGILSPYLFNMYMDDLSVKLNSCNTGCVFNNLRINHVMYADDLVVFSPSVCGLKLLLKECEEYGKSHDIKYNSKKSAIMIFRSDNMKGLKVPDFELAGDIILEVNETKYLGHLITNCLQDDDDINRQIRKLCAQGNGILRKFHMCSWEVKVTLFQAFCAPLYTAQLWWSYQKATINKLYITYHNVLKMFLGFSKYESNGVVCSVFDVKCCQAVIRNLVYKFLCRLELSTNNIIVSLRKSSIYYSSRLKMHWHKLMYVNR